MYFVILFFRLFLLFSVMYVGLCLFLAVFISFVIYVFIALII